MGKSPPHHITRRQFLVGAGAALAGAALACGREQGATSAVPVSTSAPAATTPATASPFPPVVPTAPPEQAADLVLLNGKAITVDAADTISQAVAVKDGLIQAVGTDDEIAASIGEATQVSDLGGRAVTPGLIDAHNHFQIMGLMGGYYVPFLPPEVKNIEELKAGLAEAVAQTPEGEWVQGYFMVVAEGRLPNKQDLDPVSPNHPVWIMQQGGHYGSANSLALQVAGITAATPDPTGGVIERDAGGEPSGVFYNHRAMDLLRRHIPRYTVEMVRANIASTQPLFAACGVTSFQDNNVHGVDTVRTYLEGIFTPKVVPVGTV